MTSAVVTKAAFPVLIQDRGRRGVSFKGLSEGGAMDSHAYYWANKLLGNSLDSAALEILMGQFTVEFTSDTMIAVTGADLNFSINGQPRDIWCSHPVKAGDTLAFGSARSGLRAYLAVQGGWQTPVQFNSRSVVVRESLGGLHGAPLKAGDALPFQPSSPDIERYVDPRFIPDYSARPVLKVVPGYQHDEFSPLARAIFGSSSYKVSQSIDRMGYRLSGPAIRNDRGALISEGIALGAVQVPPDGQPIVLMKDRQTIGGYPKMGCVTARDVSRLSQCAPGMDVSFEFTDISTARNESILFERYFKATVWDETSGRWCWP